MNDALLGRILWYELMTNDKKAAEEFYSTVVGWTVTPFEGAPEPYSMWMRGGAVPVAGVMALPEGLEARPHWSMYVGVPAVEEAVARVEQLGGSAVSEVLDIPNVGRMRAMRDPQQAMFWLFEPESAPAGDETEPQLGDCSWHELMTADAEVAMRFYSEMFGWRTLEAMDMGEMGKYHIFGRAFPLGGIMNTPEKLRHVPPRWGLYFRIANVHAAAERVKEHGGQVLNGPMEVPGGEWIVNCMDPQGAAFSLHHK